MVDMLGKLVLKLIQDQSRDPSVKQFSVFGRPPYEAWIEIKTWQVAEHSVNDLIVPFEHTELFRQDPCIQDFVERLVAINYFDLVLVDEESEVVKVATTILGQLDYAGHTFLHASLQAFGE
jgi:hypothetical protein